MASTAKQLFDNLITFEELLKGVLRGQFAKRSVYRWVEQDKMPHKKIKGRLMFPKDEVIRWLERTS